MQVEVRPELWGRYAAGLNRLQGCLTVLTPQPQHQQQQQQVLWPSQGDAAVLSTSDVQQLHAFVLQLLLQLEGSIQQRKAPTGKSR